jgi:hypothetical protein
MGGVGKNPLSKAPLNNAVQKEVDNNNRRLCPVLISAVCVRFKTSNNKLATRHLQAAR